MNKHDYKEFINHYEEQSYNTKLEDVKNAPRELADLFEDGSSRDREDVVRIIRTQANSEDRIALAFAVHERLTYGHDRQRLISMLLSDTSFEEDLNHGYTAPQNEGGYHNAKN